MLSESMSRHWFEFYRYLTIANEYPRALPPIITQSSSRLSNVKSLDQLAAVLGEQTKVLIRPLTDQNSLAHSLRPIDMMRQGWLSSFRQASQQ